MTAELQMNLKYKKILRRDGGFFILLLCPDYKKYYRNSKIPKAHNKSQISYGTESDNRRRKKYDRSRKIKGRFCFDPWIFVIKNGGNYSRKKKNRSGDPINNIHIRKGDYIKQSRHSEKPENIDDKKSNIKCIAKTTGYKV